MNKPQFDSSIGSLSNRRVMVIGWDSATWKLLQPWMGNGELPTLRLLLQNGSSGTLLSTKPPLSPAAWTSFVTGQNPGQHGVFDHLYRSDNSYQAVPVNAKRRKSTPIWSLLEQQDKSVGLINIPVTFPPEPVKG